MGCFIEFRLQYAGPALPTDEHEVTQMRVPNFLGIAACTTAAAMFLSAPSGAAPLIIDDFTDTQPNVVDNTASATAGSGETGFGTGPSILGGQRDIYLQLMSSAFGNDANTQINALGDGTFSFNTGSGSTAMALIQYDGFDSAVSNDLSDTGNAHGLGADFSDHDALAVEILQNDHEILSEIVFYSGTGNWQVHQFTKDVVTLGSPFIHVASFDNWAGDCSGTGAVSGLACTSGSGFDPAAISAVEVWIEGASANDLTLGFIQVPEPATIGLMGLGMLGLGLARQRRRRA